MTNLAAGARYDLPGSAGEAGADVRPMIMLHDALRREFRLLPALVRGVPDADSVRAQVIAGHVEFLTALLHAHHSGEDLVLWPILLERGPEEIAPVVQVMAGHHDQIDQLTRQIAATLTEWSANAGSTVGKSLADTLDRLIEVLEEHLGAEEKSILPVAANHVTPAEWDQMGRAAGAKFDPALVPVGVGMLMYEGDPEVVEADMARMAPEARAALKKTAPQAYEAHSLRVHGDLPSRKAD